AAPERVAMVFVGGTAYISLPQFDGVVPHTTWVSEPLDSGDIVSPRNTDLAATLGMLATGPATVVPAGRPRVDGAPAHAYRVTVRPSASGRSPLHAVAGVPPSAVRAAGDAMGTSPDTVLVDVADATGRIVRVAGDVDLTVGGDSDVARVTADLRYPGRPVRVGAPAAGSVVTRSQLQAALVHRSPAVST
ncbi:MAG TPA: hypothetical protein VKW77_05105, partial [Acidimicrobiales bacterium]|nr:hypothetical protein [Acidimicrobiales bacterium]